MHSGRVRSGCRGVYPSMHWGICPGGLPRGDFLACTEADTPPPGEQNSWHTLVKTLPFRNYVTEGNKIWVWFTFLGVIQSLPAANATVNNVRKQMYTESFSQLDGNTKGGLHFNAERNLGDINKVLTTYIGRFRGRNSAYL